MQREMPTKITTPSRFRDGDRPRSDLGTSDAAGVAGRAAGPPCATGSAGGTGDGKANGGGAADGTEATGDEAGAAYSGGGAENAGDGGGVTRTGESGDTGGAAEGIGVTSTAGDIFAVVVAEVVGAVAGEGGAAGVGGARSSIGGSPVGAGGGSAGIFGDDDGSSARGSMRAEREPPDEGGLSETGAAIGCKTGRLRSALRWSARAFAATLISSTTAALIGPTFVGAEYASLSPGGGGTVFIL